MLTCPSDTKRQPAARRFDGLSAAQLSYFLNTAAIPSNTNVVMFGDRNLVLNGTPVHPGKVLVQNTDRVTWAKEIHGYRGNHVLVDGSSHQTAADLLPAADWARQSATNLLVFP